MKRSKKRIPGTFREKKTKSKKHAGGTKTVYVRGLLRGKGQGYAFLEVEGSAEDYFVPSKNLGGALNGDTVVAELISEHGETVARVTDIINKSTVYVVGTLVLSKTGEAVVLPDDGKLCQKVILEDTERQKLPPEGYKVAVKPLRRNREIIYGKLVEVLGNPNIKSLDLISIARSYGLSEEFPDEVTAVARGVGFEVDEKDIEGRADFRGDIVVTIDGEDTKDFDDAICVKKTENGYKLYVHIADVSHYVKENSVVDREALKRGTSVYLPGMVFPMLPRELSNGICSLNPNVNRLTLSCVMDIDKNGKVTRSELVKGVIKTARRMTYDEVSLIMEGSKEAIEKFSDVSPMLADAAELADLLKKRRKKRGEIEFFDPEATIVLDREGRCADVTVHDRTPSYELIEDFMLTANETVAMFAGRNKLPFVYRVHEEPPADRAETFSEMLENFGIQFSGRTSADYAALLKNVKGKKIERAVNIMGLRSMAKAKYMPRDLGHFGLALKHYCHFTSPIRRYPDLMIHRILSAYLESGKGGAEKYESAVDWASQQSSMRENVALSCERRALDCKKAEYMSSRVGETFDGLVSSVIDSGFFVELPNTVEGFVRTEGKGVTNPKKMTATVGSRTYSIGSPVRVVCKNVFMGKIGFELV